ncbi:MAG TPA: hypothetical protein VG474_16045, partial [Solirubrobacteraceae bacterium]|nr:hypothetical protein [Solirubrobacteraceae bacterium]
GCADEESGPAGDRPSSTSSAPRRATVTIAPPTATAPPQTTPRRVTVVPAPAARCGRLGELRLVLVAGPVRCDEVGRVARSYDRAGEKVQQVAGWTCATGTAQTRPVVFTCTRAGAEFVAEERG